MEKRRNAQTEQACRDQRQADAAANCERGCQVVPPNENDHDNKSAAACPEQHGRAKLAPERRAEPASRYGLRAQGLNGDRHGLHADALVQSQDHGKKECDDDAAGERSLKHPRQQCTHGAAENGGEKPWESVAKDSPGRCAAQLRETNAKRLEYLISLSSDRLRSGILSLQYLGGEQANIDNANNVTVGIDNREGEEFVENEEFARLENGSGCWNRHDAGHHQLAKRDVR